MDPSTGHLIQKQSQMPCHWLPSASTHPSRTCPATPSSSLHGRRVLKAWSLKTTSTLLVFSKSRYSSSAQNTGSSWLHSLSAKYPRVLHLSIIHSSSACFQLLSDCCHSGNHLGFFWKCLHLSSLKKTQIRWDSPKSRQLEGRDGDLHTSNLELESAISNLESNNYKENPTSLSQNRNKKKNQNSTICKSHQNEDKRKTKHTAG